jgi:hypothetical protein
MILKWKEFITEKLSQNEVLDLYNHFIRILKIHEDFFHHDTQISNDSNFKNDINKVFHKLMIGKKPFTEELFNLVGDYEKRLYGEVKIAPEESYGCSMWDVCEVILEDPDTLNINRYIQDFSKKDVYTQTTSPYSSEDISGLVSDLDTMLGEIDEVDKLETKAFDIAKEKYENEIDIIDFAIDILTSYKEEYPNLAEELEDKIEIWKRFKEERF